jgi:hypothetical protein
MIDLTPAEGAAAPASGVPVTSLLGDTGTVKTDFFGLVAMALIGCNETDTAVALPVVVPVHECTHPQPGLFYALEGSPGGSPAGISQCGTAIPRRGCRC